MEIEKLKDMLRNAAGGPVGIQMCQEAADALEQLQAENDRLKRERDAAVKDIWVPRWKSCKFGPDCDFISAVSGFPDCASCGEWEWRGLKEE